MHGIPLPFIGKRMFVVEVHGIFVFVGVLLKVCCLCASTTSTVHAHKQQTFKSTPTNTNIPCTSTTNILFPINGNGIPCIGSQRLSFYFPQQTTTTSKAQTTTTSPRPKASEKKPVRKKPVRKSQ
jgi:hypothetical protein